MGPVPLESGAVHFQADSRAVIHQSHNIEKKASSTCTMKNNVATVANQKNASNATTSRRVSFRPFDSFVEMSFTCLKEMAIEERRRKRLTAEDNISSEKDMCPSILDELGESDDQKEKQQLPSPTLLTARQASLSNGEQIVRNQQLWYVFRSLIRHDSVVLPTTNLLTIEYLHKIVEHQFEVEAERIAQEEIIYNEIQRRYKKETGEDFGATISKTIPMPSVATAELNVSKNSPFQAAHNFFRPICKDSLWPGDTSRTSLKEEMLVLY